jgi:dolichol-phosphate mannosyltransferase
MAVARVGVVVPAYNEKESIADLIRAIGTHLPDAQIVVVDDSPDEATAEALAPLLGQQVALVRRRKKGGRGSAVIEGVRHLLARDMDVVIEMDADFSHPPEQLPQLAAQLSGEQIDLLIASRYLPGSEIRLWPVSRRVFSFSSNKLARLVLSVPVSDYTNGYRVYSRRAAEIVVMTCGRLGSGFIALSEILVNLYYRGYRVSETPTVFVNRVRGESSLNGREITGAVVGLMRIWRLKRDLRRRHR